MTSHYDLQSSGTDPKSALDKALFEQMQSLANKKKDASKESTIFVHSGSQHLVGGDPHIN